MIVDEARVILVEVKEVDVAVSLVDDGVAD